MTNLKGDLSYGISQTPQVFIDCQVMDGVFGLQVNWDVRKGVFEETVIDDMFSIFEKLLNDLSVSKENWEKNEALKLPQWQEKLFKDSSLQSLCENFRLTPAYIKENPVTQDDLLNAYLDKVDAIFDDNTFGNINRSFSIKINREGKILLITVNDSPWKDKIDGNAVKIIRSLEPFPKIPNEYRKDNIEIRTLINISDKD